MSSKPGCLLLSISYFSNAKIVEIAKSWKDALYILWLPPISTKSTRSTICIASSADYREIPIRNPKTSLYRDSLSKSRKILDKDVSSVLFFFAAFSLDVCLLFTILNLFHLVKVAKIFYLLIFRLSRASLIFELIIFICAFFSLCF